MDSWYTPPHPPPPKNGVQSVAAMHLMNDGQMTYGRRMLCDEKRLLCIEYSAWYQVDLIREPEVVGQFKKMGTGRYIYTILNMSYMYQI